MVPHPGGRHVPQPPLLGGVPLLFPCFCLLPSLCGACQVTWTNSQFQAATHPVDDSGPARPAVVIPGIRQNDHRELQAFGFVDSEQPQRFIVLFYHRRFRFLGCVLLLVKKAVEGGERRQALRGYCASGIDQLEQIGHTLDALGAQGKERHEVSAGIDFRQECSRTHLDPPGVQVTQQRKRCGETVGSGAGGRSRQRRVVEPAARANEQG